MPCLDHTISTLIQLAINTKSPSIDDICYVLFVHTLYAILQYDSYKYNIKPNARLFITFLERYGSNISLKTKIE